MAALEKNVIVISSLVFSHCPYQTQPWVVTPHEEVDDC